jgi:DNA-binding IclR family transcriptional regulator
MSDAGAAPPVPAAPATEGSAGTVSRVATLLGVLADADGSVTVKHVAERMQVAPSTAHRLLQLLKKEGFVEASAESRQYAIGPAFYRVAARVIGKVSVPARAQPVIDAIAARFDETVLLGLYLPNERALHFAARADGEQKLKYQIDMHRPLSLVWGASGKAVLAFLPADTARAILAAEGPSPASGRVPPSWSDLAPELQRIRERGWAVSESEKLPDARGIAAPVYGPAGVIGCICLTSPKARMPHASIEAIGLDISSHARALSRDLGAPSP